MSSLYYSVLYFGFLTLNCLHEFYKKNYGKNGDDEALSKSLIHQKPAARMEKESTDVPTD